MLYLLLGNENIQKARVKESNSYYVLEEEIKFFDVSNSDFEYPE